MCIPFPADDDDYTPVIQTVTFPAGETKRTITVNTLNDSLAEPLESFEGVLSDPDGNGLSLNLGGQDRARVDIIESSSKSLNKNNIITSANYLHKMELRV